MARKPLVLSVYTYQLHGKTFPDTGARTRVLRKNRYDDNVLFHNKLLVTFLDRPPRLFGRCT